MRHMREVVASWRAHDAHDAMRFTDTIRSRLLACVLLWKGPTASTGSPVPSPGRERRRGSLARPLSSVVPPVQLNAGRLARAAGPLHITHPLITHITNPLQGCGCGFGCDVVTSMPIPGIHCQ